MMKKTLLASAVLLAFSLNAHAVKTEGQYQFGEGEELVVNEATAGVKRLLGGSTATNDFKTGSVVVNVGSWDYVFGGSYLTSATQGEQTIGFESTSVTINSSENQKVTVMHVVGGTGGNEVNNVASDKATTRTAALTINGGEFGVESKWTANTLESLVIGGDHFKNNAHNAASKDNVANVYLKSANTVIDGATINALVVGGSMANQYYPQVGSGVLTLNVGTANTTIKNSTVNKPIVAGGAAIGVNAISNVEEANLTIENSTVNDTIFAGGLVRYGDPTGVAEANVGKSTVTIKESTVKEVVNGRGFTYHSNGKWHFGAEEGHFHADPANDAVTDLLLVNSTAEVVDVSKGEVNLRVEGTGQTKVGQLTTEGATLVLTADGAANDANEGDITKAISIEDGSAVGATIAMDEGMYQGAVNGQMSEEGKAVVKKAKNSIMTNSLDLAASAPLAMNRILMNDVRKRLGNIRSAEGTHGVWARYDGGRLSGAMGLENDFHTLQFGIDTVPVADAPRFGVAFSYTKSDADMKRGGAEMDAFGLAAYATKMYDNGAFVDVVGRIATADTDIVVDGDKKGSMDNLALSLSAEAGWRFNMTERHYVEPQIEVTYTRVNNSDLALSNGSAYGFDNVDSVIGRAGFAAGFTCPNNMGDVYVRASVVREFMGDAMVRGGKLSHELDGGDTWYEYGIGANFNINKNTYVYADVERTGGAALDEDWRANVGVRYSF